MKTHIIPRTNGAPDWDRIPAVSIDCSPWFDPEGIRAQAQICWDTDALYLRLCAQEADILAEETGALGMPCVDSCLEFFFCPEPEDGRYFNIEFNMNRCMYLGFGSDRYASIRLLPVTENIFGCKTALIPGGWEVTYQVPVSFIRRFFPKFEMRSGGMMRGNFYKCGENTKVEHYLSWNMITSEKPDFHRSCDFGTLYFE